MEAASPVPAPVRDIRFDSLRGLMLVSMAVNHLPSDLRVITDQSLGIFSSAEGFVFISGLLAGYVYTRRLRKQGADGLRATAWRRTGMIYGWHLVAYFAVFALLALNTWITGTTSTTSPPLFSADPIGAILLGPLLLYQPGLLDILPMYCVFVMLLPFVLGELEKGRRWPVLGTSFALWAVVQLLPDYNGATIAPPLNFGIFNLLSWQLLFVGGMTIGHARLGAKKPLTPARPGLLLATGACAVFFFCLQHGFVKPLWPDKTFGIMLNKPSLGLLRLASFAIMAYLVAVLGTYLPRVLAWRPLAMLGRHSLPVVAAQCVVVAIFLAHEGLSVTATDRWIVTGITLASLFVVAAWCERSKQKSAVPDEAFQPRQVRVFASTKAHEQARAA